MKGINKFLGICLAIGLTAFTSVQTTHALPIEGSQALAGIGVTANNANIQLATHIDILFFIISSSTMDYAAVGAPPDGTILNDTTPISFDIPLVPGPLLVPFVISEATWGTLTVSELTLDDIGTVNARNLFFAGTFVPAFNGLDPNSASLQLAFTQQGGPDSAISVSGSLNTPAIPPPGGQVPEPATLVLFASGLACLVGYNWRRRY